MILNFDRLKEQFHPDYLEIKPWGLKYCFVYGCNYCVDILYIKKGGFCSWHTHRSKKNKFICLKGSIKIFTSSKQTEDAIDIVNTKLLQENETYTVKEGIVHKFQAVEDSIITEVSFVYCDPKDINRISTGGIIND